MHVDTASAQIAHASYSVSSRESRPEDLEWRSLRFIMGLERVKGAPVYLQYPHESLT